MGSFYFKVFLSIFFLILYGQTTEQYRVIGEPVRRPLVTDCSALKTECKECIQLGCYYLVLTTYLDKTLCIPAHMPVSHPALIDVMYKHENECPRNTKEVTTPDKNADQPISLPQQTEGTNYWKIILIIISVLFVTISTLIIGRFLYKKINFRAINLSPTNVCNNQPSIVMESIF